MILLLFLLFTGVPLVELWLLFKLSGMFGFFTTISIVLLTGIVGAALARWQGWQVMRRVQNELQQGLLPAKALGDGVLILVAGVLLITPGVLTDLFGLSLLVPPVRAGVRKGIQLWLAKYVQIETARFWQSGTGPRATAHDEIVDARVVSSEVVEEGEIPKYPNTQ